LQAIALPGWSGLRMGDALEYLFGAAAFVPHGYCLLWRPDLVAMHAVADAVTAIAYFSIPAAILVFVSRRPDLDHPGLAALFATFILACGITHVADLTTLWWPIYGIEGMAKAVTALASIVTAVAVWRLLPKALTVPSLAQLHSANDELRAEVARRAAAEEASAAARDDLEAQVAARTAELAQTNARLEAEITERCRAEKAAREGETRFAVIAQSLRLAVEATDLGIWDVDAATGSRRWSDELKAILRLTPDQEADYVLFASLIHPYDRDWVSERYRRAYDSAGAGRYCAQFRIRRGDNGAEHWVEATGRVHSTSRVVRFAP
jgi:PAS domain-containing protein